MDFDLVEAVRLHDLGWSCRKIARQMNNVSRETVRTRVLGFEAKFRVATCEPVQQPAAPVQQAPTSAYKPPVAMPVAPKPCAPAPVSRPAWTFVPPSKWAPDPSEAAPKPAQVPKAAAAVPVAPLTPPEPINNYNAIVAYWAARGVPDLEPDTRSFLLVRGQQNVVYATNCEQLCVGIETWRKEYRNLDWFQTAERIWVILDPREDNRAFLQSLAADIWIRERCMIVKGEVPCICKCRLLWERAHRSPFPSSLVWLQAAWSDFEKVHNFIPIPAPNCTEQIEALLAKPREPEQPINLGGSCTGPWHGYGPY
ncbi:MAG: hypothetical protein WCA19_07180 [Candidatus Acidiferrales bacterium]